MDPKRRIDNFHQRWNLPQDYEETLLTYKHRVLNAVDHSLGDYVYDVQIANRFAFLLGIPIELSEYGHGFDHLMAEMKEFRESQIYRTIDNAKKEIDLIRVIQVLLWVLEERSEKDINVKRRFDLFVDQLKVAIRLSASINIRMVKRGSSVTLYPGGALILDETLVNEPLAWLEDYPEALTHFENSLQIYQSKDETKIRNLLDNLRLALEELIRNILKNKKPLEKQKTEILSWLDQKGIHQEIINMFQTLLSQFTLYQNDAVKHGDKSSPTEVEFMIYTTGIFMRFLIELDQNE